MVTERDGSIGRRRRQGADGDLDITPMIDVTFLLLIFFMVTSTMQSTPDKDLAPAVSGENANAGNFLDLSILATATDTEESPVFLDGKLVTLDRLKEDLEQRARGGPVKLLLYVERDVRNGFVAEVEGVLSEIEGDLEFKHAVSDYR